MLFVCRQLRGACPPRERDRELDLTHQVEADVQIRSACPCNREPALIQPRRNKGDHQ